MPLYPALRPLLFAINPELVHRSTIRLCHWLSGVPAARDLVRSIYDTQFRELTVEAFGLKFRNPVGLAAGFDKHAEAYQLMPDLGFGHMEIGSVSLRPWRGNPSPTLLRLPEDRGLINRLGLNSVGAEAVCSRLQNVKFVIPTGINLVKTADPHISGSDGIEDYLQNFVKLYPLADFITLNLSCPNTADGRTFEDPEVLAPFLKQLREKESGMRSGGRVTPVLVKLSPDLDHTTLERVLEITEQYSISGYVVTNTTVRREGLKTPASALAKFGYGGLSGLPLVRHSQPMVRKVWEYTGGRKPIIAVGGIGCDSHKHPAETVWEYLNLGATLVQLYTGLIYTGPALVKLINTELMQILRNNKFGSLAEFLAR